jgi:hypothetical protein
LIGLIIYGTLRIIFGHAVILQQTNFDKITTTKKLTQNEKFKRGNNIPQKIPLSILPQIQTFIKEKTRKK